MDKDQMKDDLEVLCDARMLGLLKVECSASAAKIPAFDRISAS